MALLLLLAACHAGVSSAREAELAYVGLDAGVSRALDLGLQGYDAAGSANIDPQVGEGDVSGTMTVDGQADQGSSDNKGLRLSVALDDYADLTDLDQDGHADLAVRFRTDDGAPLDVDLQLRDMPDGTLSGTLAGTAYLDGDLAGPALYALSLDGAIEADPDLPDHVRRVVGSTHVTGTVTGPAGGVYPVDVVR